MDDKQFFKGFDDDILEPEDFDDDEDETEEDDNSDEVVDEDDDEATSSEDDDNADVESEDDEDEEEDDEDDDEDEQSSKPDEKSKNSYFAEKRRAKEAKEREAREEQIKKSAKIEAELGMIKENPYTNESINDEEDLKIYKLMKEIDESGGDPVVDLPAKIAELNRKEKAKLKAQEEENNAIAKKRNEEVAELHNAYPELNLKELANDSEYLELCEAKGGRWTMLECYEYLVSKRKNASDKANDDKKSNAVNENSKKFSKVPSSSNSGKKHSTNYLDMSDEEYLKLEQDSSKDFF